MQEMQEKGERLIRDKEQQAREIMEARVREVQHRYECEIERINESLTKLETDNYKKAQTIKSLEIDKHHADIKNLELNECLKGEKLSFEMKTENIQREKD